MKAIISDEIIYKKLCFDPTEKYTKETRHELEVLKNNLQITPQFYNKFFPRGCSAPKIYGLPKIHKNNALRPIVSTIHSPVSKLGKWLSIAFRPLLGTQSSYLGNSVDVVKKLRNCRIDSNTILCSFDVVSMYTDCDVKKCELILNNTIQNILN